MIMKKLFAVMCAVCLLLACSALSENDGRRINLTLPSGAAIDAVIEGETPQMLCIYGFQGIEIDDELLLDMFDTDDDKPLTYNSEFRAWRRTSEVPYMTGEFGEPIYDIVQCSAFSGSVMYIDTEFSEKQGNILDAAPLIFDAYSHLGDEILVGKCAFSSSEEAARMAINDLKRISGCFDYRLTLCKALTVGDIVAYQDLMDELTRAYDGLYYRCIDDPNESDEAYCLMFTLYLDGIPLMMQYDTRNYLEAAVGQALNIKRTDCTFWVSPEGYKKVSVYNMPDIIDVGQSQTIINLDQALQIFDSYVYNDGDYLYPRTIRRIYLEYIMVLDGTGDDLTGELRPFWVLNEEPYADYDAYRLQSDYWAYRIDAISGEVLASSNGIITPFAP